MNQEFIFNYLCRLRLCGDNSFHRVTDIKKALSKDKGYNGYSDNIGSLIIKLYAWGYLELDKPYSWDRGYRVKAKYLKDKKLLSPLDKNLDEVRK